MEDGADLASELHNKLLLQNTVLCRKTRVRFHISTVQNQEISLVRCSRFLWEGKDLAGPKGLHSANVHPPKYKASSLSFLPKPGLP